MGAKVRNTKEQSRVWRNDLVFPELCYKIVGILFEVFKEIGPGFPEKVYQRAVANRLRQLQIPFSEQVRAAVPAGEQFGYYFLDFLIDKKVVLELKRSSRSLNQDYKQVNTYLKATGLKLGILANFTQVGVDYRRVVNLHS